MVSIDRKQRLHATSQSTTARHMNIRRHIPEVSGFAIAFSSVVLGIAIACLFVPYAAFGVIQSGSTAAIFLKILVLVVIAPGVICLVALRSLADSEYQRGRDLLEAFLEHIPDNVFFKDRGSRFIRISRAMAEYIGLADPKLAVGKTDSDIFSPEHAHQAFEDEQEILRTGQAKIGEEKETWPDGRVTWVLTTKVPLKDQRGQIVGTMGIAHNITDRKQAEARVQYLALHDSLTGLPNRVLLEDRLNQAIALARRKQMSVGVLMLDLDRFKNVNDSFGHYVGDRLLEAVSVRLQACLRASDTIARLGGDEFVIGISLVAATQDVDTIAQKVLATLSEPFEIETHKIQISASVGISMYPANGENPEALLQFADAAMYEAKKNGRDIYCYFAPELTAATKRKRKLENDLHQACDRGQFVLHYQPLVSTKSGRVTGVEALLRWYHPDEGVISPIEFIPQLEELGLMPRVGDWVLRTACLQNITWQNEGLSPIRVAVNVSAQQFYRGNIVDSVKRALQDTALEPKWLEIELTESLTLDCSDTTIGIMKDLKGIGVTLSLDDFGTGWSSLSYLRKFPLDRIKIDRSFMRDVASDPAAEAVVKSILDLGNNLGLDCVAEGVETHQQLEYLQKQVCAEMQGFLYSPAVPGLNCGALLRSGKPGFPGIPHEAMERISSDATA